MLVCCHAIKWLSGSTHADTVRDGTKFRATKEMERGGNPSHHAHCIHLYTEFALLMQYQCKVFTEIGFLILFLNALRLNVFNIMVFYGSKMLNMLFSMFAYIFWAQLLATYYVLLTNCIPNLVFIYLFGHSRPIYFINYNEFGLFISQFFIAIITNKY